MRIANLSGRLVIVSDGNAVDVETASGGRFSADPAAIYPRWAEFRGWADQTKLTDAHPFDPATSVRRARPRANCSPSV